MEALKLGDDAQPWFYLRCVFVRGAFDAVPELTDIAVNAVRAEQAVRPDQLIPLQHSTGTLLAEKLQPNGSGLPCQEFTTNNQPVLQSSFQLFTIENNVLHAWKLKADFDASNCSDRHFMFDSVSGTIRFGNGDHGRVAPANATVAAVYLATRADAGNLGAGCINKLADSAWNHDLLAAAFGTVQAGLAEIHNRAASGGAAAETLSQVEGRAVAMLNETTRVVTAADCESLALNTPGTHIARVAAKPNFHPAFPCAKTPGMIAVVVVPFLPAAEPTPSSGLLRAVREYLQPQRILGTRVEVFGPGYVEVVVQAQVQAGTGRDPAALGDIIVAALNAFFHPLTGGPDGNGWPFGRDVYRSEVLQRIARIDGVDHVVSLALLARGATQPVCGNVCLRIFELVAAGVHQIEVIS
jgi:predicted phage baseplate assembly protein